MSSGSESAALTLYNAGSQIRCFSERTEEAAVVNVPLQLEVQEVPAHTEVQHNSTCTHALRMKKKSQQQHKFASESVWQCGCRVAGFGPDILKVCMSTQTNVQADPLTRFR